MISNQETKKENTVKETLTYSNSFFFYRHKQKKEFFFFIFFSKSAN